MRHEDFIKDTKRNAAKAVKVVAQDQIEDAPQEDKQTYVKLRGGYCPFCESRNLNPSSSVFDKGNAYQYLDCLDCGRSWIEVYNLTDLEASDL